MIFVNEKKNIWGGGGGMRAVKNSGHKHLVLVPRSISNAWLNSPTSVKSSDYLAKG